MRRIKIALIGLNRYSHSIEVLNTLAAMPETFELVGYALPENERQRLPEKAALLKGYREMTVEDILADGDIEAVAIETDELALTKYAIMSARAGKHIHMEKPGGASLSEFEQLIDLVKQKKTVFHTGYMYRYNPVIRDLIARVKAGEIGEVVSVEAQMSARHGKDVVRALADFPGGMMFFLGCHMVDLVLQIQGVPKRIVPFHAATGRFEDLDSKDFSMVVLEYERGASLVKTTDVEMGGFARRQLVITGTQGRFTVAPLEISVEYPLQRTAYNECIDEAWDAGGVDKQSEIHDRYRPMMEAFGAMVRGEMQNPYTYEYELELYTTLMQCCQ